LPPCQRRSGTQRALRGQSPATAHQAMQQPPWAFIGATLAGQHSALVANSHPALAAATWQQALATTAPHSHNNAATTAAAAANLVWTPPSHLDQTPAPAVSVWRC